MYEGIKKGVGDILNNTCLHCKKEAISFSPALSSLN